MFEKVCNKRCKLFWIYLIVSVVLAVVFIFSTIYITFNTVYVYFPITGPSMRPTLNEFSEEADGVYLNNFSKGERGDIVIVRKESSSTVIKRLIATGGDKIAVVQTQVPTLDSPCYEIHLIYKGESVPRRIHEPYLSEDNRKNGNNKTFSKLYSPHSNKTFEEIDGIKYLVVPEGYIFYLGDNRQNSSDCSEYGPIEESKVVGRVDIIIKGRDNFLPQILDFFVQQIVKLF